MSPGNLTTIRDLKMDSHNPRKHGERNLQQIEQSLKNFGAGRSIVIDEQNEILAGNGLIEAAGNIGLSKLVVVDATGDEIVAVRRRGLTEKQKSEYRIADNRSAELAEWDTETLEAMSQEIDLEQFWDTGELQELLGIEPEASDIDAEPQIDRADELLEKWKVERGQVWQLGEHRLMCGDATKAADHDRLLVGASVDLVLTDPPYGVGVAYESYKDSEENLAALIPQFMPLLTRWPVVLLTSGTAPMWLYPRPTWVLAWIHPAGMGVGPWGFTYFNPVLAYGNDPQLKARRGSYPDALVLAADREGVDGHPTPKPIKVWEWLLTRGSVNYGDIVLDPFLGSGTTLIACQRLSRRCFAMEIAPEYVAVCLQRFLDATEQQPTLSK